MNHDLNSAAKERIYAAADACSRRIARERLYNGAAEDEVELTLNELLDTLNASRYTKRAYAIENVFRVSLSY